MSDSDSQSLSARDYDDSVEIGSFLVSSYDSIIHAVKTYLDGPVELSRSPVANPEDCLVFPIGEAKTRPVIVTLVTEDVGTSGQGKSSRVVRQSLYWPADLPPDSAPGPDSIRRKFLNTEGLSRHTYLLTLVKTEEITALLTGWVKFNARRS
nr:hypothetical protein Itr_chr12CG13640 [Ipomoea trifida]